jgi:hypothetical protein
MLKVVDKQQQSEEHGQHYAVEAIRNHRKTKLGYEFLVKWKRYPEADNSWVKAADFNSQKAINAYWKKLKTNSNKSSKK